MPLSDISTTVVPRRSLLAGALGLGLGVSLSACSGGANVASSPSSASSTRTVTTANGPLEVPAQPQRIVAVGYDTPFQLHAVGVTPVGIFDYSRWYDQYPSADVEFLKPIATIGAWGEPDLEKVAALTPDLIVGIQSELESEVYTQLSQLAPTALFDTATRGDWRTMSGYVADVAGVSGALAEVQAAYEQRLGELSTRYASALKDNDWVHYSFGDSDGQFSVQFPSGATGALLAALGVNFAKVISTDNPEHGYVSYSVEQADLLADATVGLFPLDAAGKEFAALAETRSSKVWQALPFVRAGHDYGLVLFTGVSTYPSAIAALDELETVVLTKLG